MIGPLPISHAALLGITFLLGGSLFLFFFFWSISKMPSLNKAPADVAIPSMNAINKALKTPLFSSAFFLTPLAYLACGLLTQYIAQHGGALFFYLSGIIYVIGVVIVTGTINEPLNFQLAQVKTATSNDNQQTWQTYSTKWQFWNNLRTLSSGIALLLFFIGVFFLLKYD